ncbi:MAG: hypothetical protein E5X80_28450 [Mesorhizobium sp.]|nr:MAG: hypothetical protein E5X79_26110 [Mesorhizobium sp.]TJV58363.1 MAG: hypothetical protein E5X80_28450 [Mesorhizobium sp.]
MPSIAAEITFEQKAVSIRQQKGVATAVFGGEKSRDWETHRGWPNMEFLALNRANGQEHLGSPVQPARFNGISLPWL